MRTPVPANRKHRAVDTAAAERWALLGLRLRARRIELGYPVRKAFANARGLITDKGAPNVRMVSAMENNERPGSYAPGRLEQFARAYKVTAESVYALLDGKTDELAAAVPRVLPAAPMDDGAREAAVRPYATAIWDALLRLAARGVTDPSGAMLGLGPGDAKVFDGSADAMSQADRAWLVADIQRRRAARNPDSRAAAGA
jgi:hypothetical protein